MNRSLAALFVTSVLLVACNAQQPPAGTVLATSAVTTNANSATPAKLAEVQKTLEERFKGAPVKGVRAALVAALPHQSRSHVRESMCALCCVCAARTRPGATTGATRH